MATGRGYIFIVAALVAPALAGCLAAPAGLESGSLPSPALPEPVLAVVDPEGDATIYNAAMADTLAYKCRIAGNDMRKYCRDELGNALGELPPATTIGVPGPPQLDILGATFQETPEHLIVRIEVARLDEAFLHQALDHDSPGAAWSVCWALAEVPECAFFRVQNIVGPYSAYDRYTDACNPFYWCSRRIAHEVEFGEPGAIRLLVPRALVGGGSPGDTLEGPVIAASTETPVQSQITGLAGSSSSWELTGPVDAAGRHDDAHDWYVADDSEPGAGVPLVLEAAPRHTEQGPFGFDDAADAPANRRDADVLRVEVMETPTHVTLAARLAEVREEPGDLGVGFTWGLPAGFILETFLGGDGGGWSAISNQYTFDGYGDAVPVELMVAAGAPGWLNVTFARADLGSPAAGELATLLFAWSVVGGAHVERVAGPVGLGVTQGGTLADFAGVAPPYWFRMDTDPQGGR